MIIDDPLKPEDAMSDARRDAANGWFSRTALSRLNDKVSGSIILIQQRLHMNDMAGHVRDLGDWTVLSLPAIAEEAAQIPIGPGRFHHRRPGDVLHPAREPRTVLERLRHALGSSIFAAQYQQCPVPEDGEGGDLYLLDVYRARYDFPCLKRAVIEQARRMQSSTLIIEDKGSGTALIQQLLDERPADVPYPLRFTPKEDKLTRLHAESARIEAGHVLLPRAAPWLDDFRAEFAAFPQGRHDDQVDSVSQFLSWHFARSRYQAGAIQFRI